MAITMFSNEYKMRPLHLHLISLTDFHLNVKRLLVSREQKQGFVSSAVFDSALLEQEAGVTREGGRFGVGNSHLQISGCRGCAALPAPGPRGAVWRPRGAQDSWACPERVDALRLGAGGALGTLEVL